MKLKSVYVCSNCGETSPRWMGRCPSCGSWNTMNEDVVAEAPRRGLLLPGRLLRLVRRA